MTPESIARDVVYGFVAVGSAVFVLWRIRPHLEKIADALTAVGMKWDDLGKQLETSRAVGLQKDKTYEARMGAMEKQNDRQTEVLDIQTNLLYEIRGRADKTETIIGDLRDQVKDVRDHVTAHDVRIAALEAKP